MKQQEQVIVLEDVFGGGYRSGNVNEIDFGNISTGGLFVDFGNLTVARQELTGVSNAHGGLNDGYSGTRIRPIPNGLGAGDRGIFIGM